MKKKRNPQDVTLRNIRAMEKKLLRLKKQLMRMFKEANKLGKGRWKIMK